MSCDGLWLDEGVARKTPGIPPKKPLPWVAHFPWAIRMIGSVLILRKSFAAAIAIAALLARR